MKRKGQGVRKFLYKHLSLESYLTTLSRLYFISFNLGLLKSNKIYQYPYFLNKVIKKGDVCIDIGANLGYFAVLFSDLVGKSGKVYAVEPVKPMLTILRKNTKRRKNVEIFPFALGQENKSIQLGNSTVYKNGFMASGSHSVLETEKTADIVFEAEMKKGSELFANIDKIDFIKCDIEGYEEIVIPEIETIITKHRPILLIESRGESRKKIMRFLKGHNFNSYVLEGDFLIPAKEEGSWDILVFPVEKESAFKKHFKELAAK